MIKKGSVLLICKHKFVSILEEGAIDGFIAMQVSLGFITPPQNNSKQWSFNFGEKLYKKRDSHTNVFLWILRNF